MCYSVKNVWGKRIKIKKKVFYLKEKKGASPDTHGRVETMWDN